MTFQRYDSYLDSDVPNFIALNANYYCVWFTEQRHHLPTSYNFGGQLMKCGYRGSAGIIYVLCFFKKKNQSTRRKTWFHFVHYKSNMDWLGTEPGSPQWDTCDWAMAQPVCSVVRAHMTGDAVLYSISGWRFRVCYLNCKFGILLKQPFHVVIMSSVQTATRVTVTGSYSVYVSHFSS